MRNRGFSLIEVIVVIGILAVLIGLALPVLAGARVTADEVVSGARMRDLGTVLVGHIQSSNQRFPELWAPVYRPSLKEAEMQWLGGVEHRGQWWSNAYTYYYDFAVPPQEELLRAPGYRDSLVQEHQGELWPRLTEYHLSHAFYAEPAFWNPDTQRGESQFRAQRLDAVRYPSSKLMIFQVGSYADGNTYMDNAWTDPAVPNPVLWTDLSYQPIAREDMLPAVGNAWFWETNPPVTLWDPGVPGLDTRDGVLGRDR